MRISRIILVAFLLVSCAQPKASLQEKLEALTDGFPGTVGIAVVNGDDTVCVNADAHFPMFSVVKFHQALAVCEKMRQEPPEEGFMPIAIGMTLEQTLIHSDNEACDLLFENVASPSQVDSCIRTFGITDFNIEWNEAQQHDDISRCYENWTTPLSAAKLLGAFYRDKDRDEYSRFVWETMSACQTGANRIPKYIADSVVCIAHKTGTGAPLPGGGIMAINDVACIVLPDGSHTELAVFVKDASCEAADCEELIAQIAREVINY